MTDFALGYQDRLPAWDLACFLVPCSSSGLCSQDLALLSYLSTWAQGSVTLHDSHLPWFWHPMTHYLPDTLALLAVRTATLLCSGLDSVCGDSTLLSGDSRVDLLWHQFRSKGSPVVSHTVFPTSARVRVSWSAHRGQSLPRRSRLEPSCDPGGFFSQRGWGVMAPGTHRGWRQTQRAVWSLCGGGGWFGFLETLFQLL